MALEPITRQEKIIAGQDLTPITRKEMFLKNFGGGGGGSNDVYVIKLVENYDTHAVELHGDYAGAVAALESGKSLKFVRAASMNGKERIYYESFGYCVTWDNSKIRFTCYTGFNFKTCILSDSGIPDIGGDETHVNSMYVDIPGSLFLRSSTDNSTKLFRVHVSDTGELTTEEVT